jgi:hypothetical protein
MKCEGFSEPCGKYKATRNHQNTSFVDDERNYQILLDEYRALLTQQKIMDQV